jgi:hypothetical protein
MICRKHPIRSLLTSMLRKENIRYPSDVCFFCELSINNSELQISCVFAFFMLWKQVNTNVLSDQSVHIMHTYCCVNKLSKFGAYLYSSSVLIHVLAHFQRTTCYQIYFRFSSYLLRKPHLFVIEVHEEKNKILTTFTTIVSN